MTRNLRLIAGPGSSALSVAARLVGRPSDGTGERPVGDGLFVLP